MKHMLSILIMLALSVCIVNATTITCPATLTGDVTVPSFGVLLINGAGELNLNGYSIIFEFDNTTMEVESGCWINMSDGNIYSRGKVGTVVLLHESHQIRGIGYLYSNTLVFDGDFQILEGDYLSFYDGGIFLSNTPASSILINGQAEFYGPEATYFFNDSLAQIAVYDNGILRAYGDMSMDNTPSIRSWNNGKIEILASRPSWVYLYMRDHAEIRVNGELRCSHAIFYSDNNCALKLWDGIKVIGNDALIDMEQCAVKDVYATASNANPAIHLYGAQNLANRIKWTGIKSTNNYGYGIFLQKAGGYLSQVAIECCYLERFACGVAVGEDCFAHINNTQFWYATRGLQVVQNGDVELVQNEFYKNITHAIEVTSGGTISLMDHNEIEGTVNRTSGEIYVCDAGSSINTWGEYNKFGSGTGYTHLNVGAGAIAHVANVYWGANPPAAGSFIGSGTINYIPYATTYQTCFVYCDIESGINIEGGGDSDVENAQALSKLDVSSYPNPFNPITQITYSLPQEMHVTLKVFSPSGKQVAILVDDVQMEGTHHAVFNATSEMTSGIYLYEIGTPMGNVWGKLILSK